MELRDIVLIYSAVTATIGVVISSYALIRDRSKLKVRILKRLAPAGWWGTRDCNYVVVVVRNHGRRSARVASVRLDVDVNGLLCDEEPAFWCGDDAEMSRYRGEDGLPHVVELPEGATASYLFEFDGDAAVQPLKASVFDGFERLKQVDYSIFTRVIIGFKVLVGIAIELWEVFKPLPPLRKGATWRSKLLFHEMSNFGAAEAKWLFYLGVAAVVSLPVAAGLSMVSVRDAVIGVPAAAAIAVVMYRIARRADYEGPITSYREAVPEQNDGQSDVNAS